MALVLIVAGLMTLTFGGEMLVRGASQLAERLGISPFVIGLTIVGFGTSTPELSASLIAAIGGSGDVAVGNVVGSNTFNIAVIVGLTALVAPMVVVRASVRTELMWTGAAALVPLVALTGIDGQATIGRVLGAGLVSGMGIYLVRVFRAGRRETDEATLTEAMSELGTGHPPGERRRPRVWVAVVLVGLGLAALILGSFWLVRGAVAVAQGFGVSERVIGLTIVAAGTSLPELVTSILAAVKRKPELALGNVLGSNVFNAFAILGITALVRPQTMVPAALAIDVSVTAAATGVLALACLARGRVGRVSGALLLVGYAGYLWWLLSRGGP